MYPVSSSDPFSFFSSPFKVKPLIYWNLRPAEGNNLPERVNLENRIAKPLKLPNCISDFLTRFLQHGSIEISSVQTLESLVKWAKENLPLLTIEDLIQFATIACLMGVQTELHLEKELLKEKSEGWGDNIKSCLEQLNLFKEILLEHLLKVYIKKDFVKIIFSLNSHFLFNHRLSNVWIDYVQKEGHSMTFKQLCQYHDVARMTECWDLFANDKTIMELFFHVASKEHQEAKNAAEAKKSFYQILERFGIKGFEHILDCTLTLPFPHSTNAAMLLYDMSKLSEIPILISAKKEESLRKGIEEGAIENLLPILMLAEVLKIDGSYLPSKAAEKAIIKMYDSQQENIKHFLRSNYKNGTLQAILTNHCDNLPPEIAFFIQRELHPQQKANSFSLPPDDINCHRIQELANKKLQSLLKSEKFISPPTKIYAADLLRVNGCCAAITTDISLRALEMDEQITAENLKEIASRHHRSATEEAFTQQVADQVMLSEEIFWETLLTNMNQHLKDPKLKMAFFFLISIHYGIDEKKMVHFLRKFENAQSFQSLSATVFHLSQSLLPSHVDSKLFSALYNEEMIKQAKKVLSLLSLKGALDLEALTAFVEMLEIQTADQEILKDYMEHFHSLILWKSSEITGRTDFVFGDDWKTMPKEIVSSLKEQLTHLNGLKRTPIANPYPMRDLPTYFSWLKNYQEGVYHLTFKVFSGREVRSHWICLIIEKDNLYLLDPNSPLINENILTFSLKDIGATAHELNRYIFHHYPCPQGTTNHAVIIYQVKNSFEEEAEYFTADEANDSEERTSFEYVT